MFNTKYSLAPNFSGDGAGGGGGIEDNRDLNKWNRGNMSLT